MEPVQPGALPNPAAPTPPSSAVSRRNEKQGKGSKKEKSQSISTEQQFTFMSSAGGAGGSQKLKQSSTSTSTSTTTRQWTKSEESMLGERVIRGKRKERWLLTRKTWRYMTDAVGNLLPIDNTVHVQVHPTPGAPISSGGATSFGLRNTDSVILLSSSPFTRQPHQAPPKITTTAAAGPPASHNTPRTSWSRDDNKSSGVGVGGEGRGGNPQGTSLNPSSTKGTQSMSSSMSMPMNLGPWSSSVATSTSQLTINQREEEMLQGEERFFAACDNQSEFLIWTGGPPPPRFVKGGGGGGGSKGVEGVVSGGEEEEEDWEESEWGSCWDREDRDDCDEYDEYDDDEAEQVTVREACGPSAGGGSGGGVGGSGGGESGGGTPKRKSSIASSITSVMTGLGQLLRSPSTPSAVPHTHQPPGGQLRMSSPTSPSSPSGPWSSTWTGGGGSEELHGQPVTFRSIGIQTDPFPEEMLNRLRRQCAIQETYGLSSSVVLRNTGTGPVDPATGKPGEITRHMELHFVPDNHPPSLDSPDSPFPSANLSPGPGGRGAPLNAASPRALTSKAPGSGSGSSVTNSSGGMRRKESGGEDILTSTPTATTPATTTTTTPGGAGEGPEDGSDLTLTTTTMVTVTSDQPTTVTSVVPSLSSTPSTTPSAREEKKGEESGYSSSISDTVMRYLRMVRKNSKVDKSDVDRFKTVNYDRSLRNIKSKNVSIEEALEFEKNKQLKLQQEQQGITPDASAAPPTTSTTTTTTTTATASASDSSKKPVSVPVQVPVSVEPDGGEKDGKEKGGKKEKGGETKVGRMLPSVGIQAGESLVKFLKLFNRRKTSDFSSSSYPSSESSASVPPLPSPTASFPPGGGAVSGSTMGRSRRGSSGTSGSDHDFYLQMTGQGHGQSPGHVIHHMTSTWQSSDGDNEPEHFSFSPRLSLSTTVESVDEPSVDDEQDTELFESFMGHRNTLTLAEQMEHFRPQDNPRSRFHPSHHQQQHHQQQQQQQQPHLQHRSNTKHSKSSSSINPKSAYFAPPPGSGLGQPGHFAAASGSVSVHQSHSNHQLTVQSQSSFSESGVRRRSRQEMRMLSDQDGNCEGVARLGDSEGGAFTYPSSAPSSSSSLPFHSKDVSGQSGQRLRPQTSSSSHSSSTSRHAHRTHLANAPTSPASSSSDNNNSRGDRSGGGQTFIRSLFSGGSSRNKQQGAGLGRGRSVEGERGDREVPYQRQTTLSNSNSNSNSSSNASGPSWIQSQFQGQSQGHERRSCHDVESSLQQVASGGQGGQGRLTTPGTGTRTGPGSGSGTATGSGQSLDPSGDNTQAKVMQKSKSSSSVVVHGGGGGGGGGGGSGGGSYTSQSQQSPPAKLISKSKLFKSKKQQLIGSLGGGGGGLGGGAQVSPATPTFQSYGGQGPGGIGGQIGKPQSAWAPQSGKVEAWAKLLKNGELPLEWTHVRQLTELERLALQKVSLTTLHGMDLGVDIKIPREKSGVVGAGEEGGGAGAGAGKPKRRPYLLKKKALSTGFFDSSKREQLTKESGFGHVFAISLSQCVKNDLERKKTQTQLDVSSSHVVPSSSSVVHSASERGTERRERSRRGRDIIEGGDSVRALTASTSSMSSIHSYHSTPETPSTPTSPIHPMCLTHDATYQQPPAGEEGGEGDHDQVPELVTACVKHLEAYGLHTTGIFRVSSSLKRTRQLREEIDSGGKITLGAEHSPHDVAALLKEFLRDLPEPLLSRDLYQAFLRILKIRERKAQLESMQSLIHLLPVPNRDTLQALLSLFSNVVLNSGDRRSRTTGELVTGNKMEAYSLATLIAPNILPCMPMDGSSVVSVTGEQSAILTRERRDSIDVVNYMITNFRDLFQVSPDTLEKVYLQLMDTHPDQLDNLLRTKFPAQYQQVEDADHAESGSGVFEGDMGNVFGLDDLPRVILRKREEILHEGAGKGGGRDARDRDSRSSLGGESTSGRLVRELGSREKMTATEKGGERWDGGSAGGGGGGQSGADSDSSSTKSTSRWFRKARPTEPKHRASSDSGGGGGGSDKEKEKERSKLGGGVGGRSKKKEGRGMSECKRASSLDSVNVRELRHGVGGGHPDAGTARFLIDTNTNTSWEAGGGVGVSVLDLIDSSSSPSDRQRSSSDQALKIPLDLSRRQSSPFLESRRVSESVDGGGSGGEGGVGGRGRGGRGSEEDYGDEIPGVIRASLKIQMPINIDDTDIPFIEEDNSEAHSHSFPKEHLQASSNQASSPVEDYTCTFPYEEIQARICLGQPPTHFQPTSAPPPAPPPSAPPAQSLPRRPSSTSSATTTTTMTNPMGQQLLPRKTASISSIPSISSSTSTLTAGSGAGGDSLSKSGGGGGPEKDRGPSRSLLPSSSSSSKLHTINLNYGYRTDRDRDRERDRERDRDRDRDRGDRMGENREGRESKEALMSRASRGRETKGANMASMGSIGAMNAMGGLGLIKSKTADFEKLVATKSGGGSAVQVQVQNPNPTPTQSLNPNVQVQVGGGGGGSVGSSSVGGSGVGVGGGSTSISAVTLKSRAIKRDTGDALVGRSRSRLSVAGQGNVGGGGGGGGAAGVSGEGDRRSVSAMGLSKSSSDLGRVGVGSWGSSSGGGGSSGSSGRGSVSGSTSSPSHTPPTWKRSEIIASPARKNNKETFL